MNHLKRKNKSFVISYVSIENKSPSTSNTLSKAYKSVENLNKLKKNQEGSSKENKSTLVVEDTRTFIVSIKFQSFRHKPKLGLKNLIAQCDSDCCLFLSILHVLSRNKSQLINSTVPCVLINLTYKAFYLYLDIVMIVVDMYGH